MNPSLPCSLPLFKYSHSTIYDITLKPICMYVQTQWSKNQFWIGGGGGGGQGVLGGVGLGLYNNQHDIVYYNYTITWSLIIGGARPPCPPPPPVPTPLKHCLDPWHILVVEHCTIIYINSLETEKIALYEC